ncbi:MAG: OsmC family protein [Polyangiales bacterium]
MGNDTAPPSTEPVSEFSLRVEQVEGFTFNVRFDKDHYPTLRMSEPAPLGDDAAPNPARVLAAAIGDCLSASLLFCMKRRGVPLDGVGADVTVTLVRNERKRLRIGKVKVALHAAVAGGEAALAPCLETFEDCCVVTQSVRDGIDVDVSVDAAG